MKNKISDLRNHMFAALERLSAEDLTEEQVKTEISKAAAISELGKVIVDSAKTEVMYAKLTGKRSAEPTQFLEEPDQGGGGKKPERPPAEYSNKTPMRIAGGE